MVMNIDEWDSSRIGMRISYHDWRVSEVTWVTPKSSKSWMTILVLKRLVLGILHDFRNPKKRTCEKIVRK
jgi:hypothetical protein